MPSEKIIGPEEIPELPKRPINMESEKIINPTPLDLQNLQIEVSSLGRGDFIHDLDGHLGVLHSAMELAKIYGWTDNYLQIWNEYVGKIKKIIIQVKIEEAKEKGL